MFSNVFVRLILGDPLNGMTISTGRAVPEVGDRLRMWVSGIGRAVHGPPSQMLHCLELPGSASSSHRHIHHHGHHNDADVAHVHSKSPA